MPKLLHTAAFTHRHFYTHNPLHADAFTHRGFYTQKLLPTDAFTHRSFYTQKLLHTEALTHRNFHMSLCTKWLWPAGLPQAIKYVPVLLCTTKLAQNTSQNYFVLQSLHKALPSTTVCYKACTNYFPVLL